MLKKHAISDAQRKANLSKQPQVVFRYIVGEASRSGMSKTHYSNVSTVQFDYTHQSLWDKRRHHQPIVTKVTTVTSVTD
jgi:hypothetical protein